LIGDDEIGLKFNPFRLIGETNLKWMMKISKFSSLFLYRIPESPKARGPRPNVEGRDGTPQKKKQCNCKHSRCLKL